MFLSLSVVLSLYCQGLHVDTCRAVAEVARAFPANQFIPLPQVPNIYKPRARVFESGPRIQQILELVEPERSNTVIVLTSDHGEHLGAEADLEQRSI